MKSDDEIIADLTGELLAAFRVPPYKFGIECDAKNEPTRVRVHRIEKAGKQGTVEFTNIREARTWVGNALHAGYPVSRIVGRVPIEEVSVEWRRNTLRRAEERAKLTSAQLQAMDDEIPF